MELEINNITKIFKDKVAVNKVSFKMENGVYGLLGTNGAGKTTLIRMISTLLEPTSGNINLYYKNEEQDKEVSEDIIYMDEKYRQLLGYLPQKFGYYPEFSSQDYLIYIGSLKGLKPSYAKKRSEELLKEVSLWHVKNKKIKTFSEGMKRRLGIAQAIMNDPKILILDEPTAGLDPKERIHFRNLISELGKDKIILLSTHIVSDIESIANEILIMKNGCIIAKGAVEQLLTVIKDSVWTVTVTNKELEEIERDYVISNAKTSGNKILVRLISSNKPKYLATKQEASLEDLFMYYFGREDESNGNV